MKRFLTIAILILPALVSCVDGPDNGNGSAVNVVLSQDKVDIKVGETATLTATVLPASLNMGVVWSVLDEEYATVQDGKITGVSEGVTYVIATSEDGYQKASCMVSVNPPIKYSVSVTDEFGQPLEAVYGYPGMTLSLVAATSDGETGHSFTWSVDDTAAGSITADGLLTFGMTASSDAAHIYDAQSYVKVVSEDGYGCRIPLRSSMLKGIQVDDIYYPVGTVTVVQKEERYAISAMYEGADFLEAIPADVVEFELSNETGFSLMKVGSACTLITGQETNITTSLSVSMQGSADKVEIAEFKIDKVYPIKAWLVGSSSSTLAFTWTEGISEDNDINNPYTINLYKDENSTDLVVSYSIPAGDECWRGGQPKFVFSGLEPSTTYWFKVFDTGGGEDMESALISGTTDSFVIVEPGSDPATVGDILLAEDFSEMCWAADEITQAAGYDVADDGVAYNSDTQKSFTSREAARFVGYTKQYAQRSLTAQSVAKKESGVRISKWAQGQYARIYIGPGYLFLSTLSYGTHIITPALDNIPDGKTAKVIVTVHAAGYASGKEAAFAVQHDKKFNLVGSSTQTNKNTLDLTTNVQTITYKGGLTQLDEFSVTLEGLVKGDRIAFGPTTETAKDNGNMMIISDMTIELLEAN